MRTLSSKWLQAEEENKKQRNALRKAFWADLGIKPVTVKDANSLSERDRSKAYLKVWNLEQNSAQIDDNIREVSRQSNALIVGMNLSRHLSGLSFADAKLGLNDLSTKAWRSHFVTDASSAFEATRFIKRGS